MAVVARAPLLLGNAIALVPAELGAVSAVGIALVGLIATAGAALLVVRAWPRVPSSERAHLRWLVPGSLLAIVGTCGGLPGGRELAIATVGLAPLLATLMVHGLFDPDTRFTAPALKAGVACLAVIHLGLAPLFGVAGAESARKVARATEGAATHLGELVPPGGRYFLLAAADPMVWMYAGSTLLALAPNERRCGAVVSTGKATHRIDRGPNGTIVVQASEPSMLANAFERLFRPLSNPVHVGMEIRQCGATIRVAKVEGGAPTRLELDLDTTAPQGVTLLVWQDGALRRVEPSALSAGKTVVWSPGPAFFL